MNSKYNIPISKTIISKQSKESVLRVLNSGWLVQGKEVNQFGNKWTQITNSKFAICVNSCTSALYLSLKALGLKKNDEVILPSFTWISTANVVEQLGGKPIFCDIDLNTFNIDTNEIEKKISKKVKFILPVHLFGLPCDMDKILSISKKYNLKIVEDAACAIGTKYKGKHVGSFGNSGCFSLHPRKLVTTGEGGVITVNTNKLNSLLRALRDHGAKVSDLSRHKSPEPYILADHVEAGYNFRLTDIQASIGNDQLNNFNKILYERRRIASIYDEYLKDLYWIQTPINNENYYNSYQSYPCLFKPEKITLKNLKMINKLRNKIMKKLFEKKISTRPATHAIHLLTFYKKKYDINPVSYKNSLIANNCSLSLPLYNGISEEEIEFVAINLKKAFI